MLGAAIFALTTSEYMVAGLMPALAAEFGVSFAAIGYLVTFYAGAMAVGGPLLTTALLRVPRKNALLGLIVRADRGAQRFEPVRPLRDGAARRRRPGLRFVGGMNRRRAFIARPRHGQLAVARFIVV